MDGAPNDDERRRRERVARGFADLAALGEFTEHFVPQPRRPYRIPALSGYEFVMNHLNHPIECHNSFRMTAETFHSLHNQLVHNYGLTSTRGMASIEALGMFLWMVGGPQSFSSAYVIFSRSKDTIHRKFREVLKCVSALGGHIIRPIDPTFTEPHPRVMEARFWPYFSGAIGAIDGTHIPVSVPDEEVPRYTNRHGTTSQNVMGVCGFDMRFTCVIAGWANSVHDQRILSHTLQQRPESFSAPPLGTLRSLNN